MRSITNASDEIRDEDLVAAWRARDAEAGDELFRRHFATVYNFFRNKVSDAQTHRDLVQRTFLGCVESRDRVPDGVAFRAYLLGIAHKQLLRFLRHRHRENRALDAASRVPLDSLFSASRVAAAHREQHLLLQALRQLPADRQVVLELYYWEDLSVAEIALITAVAPGTVKSRLARAREQLLALISELADDEAVRRSTVDGLDRWAASLRRALARDAAQRHDSGSS